MNRLITFNGTVKDSNGRPRLGVAGITFALYAAQEGGDPLWRESQTVQTDEQGRYTALLGLTEKEGLPLDVFSNGKAQWLGVQVQGQEEQPRILLVAVPYALKAADADTIGGKPLSSFVLYEDLEKVEAGSTSGIVRTEQGAASIAGRQVPGRGADQISSTGEKKQFSLYGGIPPVNLGGTGTTNILAKFVDSANIGNSAVIEVGGKVGIGTATPGSLLSLGVSGDAAHTLTLGGDTGRFGLYSWVPANAVFMDFTNGAGTGYFGQQGSVGNELVASGGLPYSLAFVAPGTTRAVQFATGNTARLTVDSSGNVGIGTANPGSKLEVAGNIRLSGTGNGLVFPDGTKQTTAGGGATANFSSSTADQIVNVTQLGTGLGINVVSGSDAVKAQADSANAAGVWGQAANTTGNNTIGVKGTSASSDGMGLYGQALGAQGMGVQGDGGSIGVSGYAFATGGTGVLGDAEVDGGFGVKGVVRGTNVTAGLFEVAGISSGNTLIGKVSGLNVFRVDTTGKGYFNGGTQTSGADFAEAVEPVGSRQDYEPGDVLVINQAKSRAFSRSSQPYSTNVAGIYSTKPGVLATPHLMDDPRLSGEIPLAVVGIVPSKVSAENGPIERGDLLVTSSTVGHAMRGTDRVRMLGAIVGKALEPLAHGTGIIQVLVALQ